MSSFTYIDGAGTSHTIPAVRFGSLSGLDGNTGTVETVSNAEHSAVIKTRISRTERIITLTIPVQGSTVTELETNENTYLSWFRQTDTPGKLQYTRNDTTTREIPVYIQQGYPTRTYESNLFCWLEVHFIAVNPYWTSTTSTAIISGTAVTNDGDYPAELTLTASASAITYGPATISSVTGQDITGATITITDDTVTVVSGTTNVLYKVAASSTFPLLPTGSVTVTGASGVFYKRWSNA